MAQISHGKRPNRRVVEVSLKRSGLKLPPKVLITGERQEEKPLVWTDEKEERVNHLSPPSIFWRNKQIGPTVWTWLCLVVPSVNLTIDLKESRSKYFTTIDPSTFTKHLAIARWMRYYFLRVILTSGGPKLIYKKLQFIYLFIFFLVSIGYKLMLLIQEQVLHI